MVRIPDDVRTVLESGRLAHLVTLNADGSPQVTIVWVGLEGDEIVSGHLSLYHKLKNVQRDPRVALSIELDTVNPIGLTEYLVVNGRARVQEGGGAELLQRLAYVYIGAGVKFPPMDNPPSGYVLRITPERFGGVGSWANPMG